jgi:hypothetical protein
VVRATEHPARAGNGAGRGCFAVVRACPLRTVQDRCEWHACGTASEDDPRTQWRRWLRLDRRVRLVQADHCVVKGQAAVNGSPLLAFIMSSFGGLAQVLNRLLGYALGVTQSLELNASGSKDSDGGGEEEGYYKSSNGIA